MTHDSFKMPWTDYALLAIIVLGMAAFLYLCAPVVIALARK